MAKSTTANRSPESAEPVAIGEQMLNLIDQATAADLKAVEDKIGVAKNDVAALEKLRDMLRSKLDLWPQPQAVAKTKSPHGPAGGMAGAKKAKEEKKQVIARLLIEKGRPMQLEDICKTLDLHRDATAGIMLDADWFTPSLEGWRIAPAGRRAVG